ncbi:MAG: methyl-accepting chemotaxis protein [Deltaproteobacteria bacterium]|nr:methyl-accepting chemotaxis protein [Deltaproteobacteria bacterium]
MNSRKINMRRTYYIKKDFQKRFILEYLALIFLGAVLANGMLYTLLDKGIDEAFYRAHISITTTGDVVRSPLVLTNMAVVFASLAAVLVSIWLNSWKIGNLLHCLTEGIEGLKNGDLTVQVKACKDHLTEVAETFNKAVMQLNRKITSVKDELTKIEETALSLETDRAGTLEQLLKGVESIEEQLSVFKLRQ